MLLPRSTTIHSAGNVLPFSAHQRELLPLVSPSTAKAPTSPLCTEEVVVGLFSAMLVELEQPVDVAVDVGVRVGVLVGGGVFVGVGLGAAVGVVVRGGGVFVRVRGVVGVGAPPILVQP